MKKKPIVITQNMVEAAKVLLVPHVKLQHLDLHALICDIYIAMELENVPDETDRNPTNRQR